MHGRSNVFCKKGSITVIMMMIMMMMIMMMMMMSNIILVFAAFCNFGYNLWLIHF